MNTNPLLTRAQRLLQIHHGACFIPANHELTATFLDLERDGLVKCVMLFAGAIKGMNVRRKGFRTKQLEPELQETPAH